MTIIHFSFNTRKAYLQATFKALDWEGSLGLTDLCVIESSNLLNKLAIKCLFLFAGVPIANLITISEYISMLREIGFQDIKIEDISKSVFPGFLSFIERQDLFLGSIYNERWQGLLAYAKIVEWYSGNKNGRPQLAFVMITAKKSKISSKLY